MPELYCYDGDDGYNNSPHFAGDPHAVILTLSDEDAARYSEQRQRETRLPTYEEGESVEVTDQETGLVYRVASAPCGLGCRCAAVARLA